MARLRTATTSLVIAALAAACTAPAVAPSPDVAAPVESAPLSTSTSSPAFASGPPGPPVEPTASPSSATAAPTAASSPVVVAGLGPDALGVVVATDGLRVRSLPTVGNQSERLEPTLGEGVRVYIVDGPVTADGYAWYQVQPYGSERALPFGWIAAGSRDGEPWIEEFPLGCDTVAPSAEGLVSGEPLEHLYCSVIAGNPEITIDGDVWCTFADDHHGALSGPEWIDQAGYCELRTGVGSRWLYGQPVIGLLDEASSPVVGRYTITGHFDDPGASECRVGAMEGSEPPHPAAVILSCRTDFVVTEATPVP